MSAQCVEEIESASTHVSELVKESTFIHIVSGVGRFIAFVVLHECVFYSLSSLTSVIYVQDGGKKEKNIAFV